MFCTALSTEGADPEFVNKELTDFIGGYLDNILEGVLLFCEYDLTGKDIETEIAKDDNKGHVLADCMREEKTAADHGTEMNAIADKNNKKDKTDCRSEENVVTDCKNEDRSAADSDNHEYALAYCNSEEYADFERKKKDSTYDTKAVFMLENVVDDIESQKKVVVENKQAVSSIEKVVNDYENEKKVITNPENVEDDQENRKKAVSNFENVVNDYENQKRTVTILENVADDYENPKIVNADKKAVSNFENVVSLDESQDIPVTDFKNALSNVENVVADYESEEEEDADSDYSPIPALQTPDEKLDDWFCEDMPSISPGDESQSLDDVEYGLSPDPWDLEVSNCSALITQALQMNKLSQDTNSQPSQITQKRLLETEVLREAKRTCFGIELACSSHITDNQELVGGMSDVNLAGKKPLFSKQNSNSIVPDISNPVLEEPADVNEELFFPNKENSNIEKDSSKVDNEEFSIGMNSEQIEKETFKDLKNEIRPIVKKRKAPADVMIRMFQSQPHNVHWSQAARKQSVTTKIPKYIKELGELSRLQAKEAVKKTLSTDKNDSNEGISESVHFLKVEQTNSETKVDTAVNGNNERNVGTEFNTMDTDKEDQEKIVEKMTSSEEDKEVHASELAIPQVQENLATKGEYMSTFGGRFIPPSNISVKANTGTDKEDQNAMKGVRDDPKIDLESQEDYNNLSWYQNEEVMIRASNVTAPQNVNLQSFRLTPVKLLNKPPRVGLSKKRFSNIDVSEVQLEE